MELSGMKEMTSTYAKLSSMKGINSAKDNAAGTAIVEGMKAQATEQSIIADGASSKKDSLQVTDGALQSITDNLNRIRELSIQSGNATYSTEDKESLQKEIEQLKQGISFTAKNTEFNTKKVLDENTENNATLQALGMEGYDVTNGNFDVSVIDDAIQMINSNRSSIGASSNALDSTIAYNKLANENLTLAYRKVEDLDVGKAVSNMKKGEVLNEYRTFAQQAEQNQAQSMIDLLKM